MIEVLELCILLMMSLLHALAVNAKESTQIRSICTHSIKYYS